MPSFIKIKAAVCNERSCAAIKIAEKVWLKYEIKHKYKELAEKELELYSSYLELTRDLNEREQCEWFEFDRKVQQQTAQTIERRRRTHNQKAACLIEKKSVKEQIKPEFLPDFVINESSVQFS